jgi:ribosomal protein S18 acetylase RimI-like enzyme
LEIIVATVDDLPSILTLQKLAYQSEAELVGDYSIPPLTQTLDGITDDFNKSVFLKAVENDEIIGSVRVRLSDNTSHIGRLIVSPTRQNRGIGTALLHAAEELYPETRFELFTSDKSERNLSLYIKNGYKEFKREPLNENVNAVFLEKCGKEAEIGSRVR